MESRHNRIIMDTFEISNFLKIVNHSLISNVYAANRMPVHMTLPIYLISNLDPDTKPGSHWIAIYINADGVGEYFDTFGRKPYGYHLSFLKRNTCRWTYNSNVIQNIFSSLCGEYCLVYLYFKFKGMRLREFLELFNENTLYNDWLLKEMFNCIFL